MPSFRVKAEWYSGIITIEEDGTVEPSDAPMKRVGNIYFLTNDIKTSKDGIVVKRDGIVIDGGGHVLEGSGITGYRCGIGVEYGKNIEIRNIRIMRFKYGIELHRCVSNITIRRNSLEDNEAGVHLFDSSGNTISENKFINCGILVSFSYNNIVKDNSVNGKPLIYLEGESDEMIKDVNAGQVVLVKCKNITVEGLRMSSTAGIQLAETGNSSVINNEINNSRMGIYLLYASGNGIYGNILENDESGISLWYSSENAIARNVLRGDKEGIYLEGSSNNTIIENSIENNDYGIYLDYSSGNAITGNKLLNSDLFTITSYNNTVGNNTVNGKPLIYLEGESNKTIVEAGQVVLVKCKNIVIKDLRISNTATGILLVKTNNSKIMCNELKRNRHAIYLHTSTGNQIAGNSLEDNSCAIWLDDSSGNRIYCNDFINNEKHVHAVESINAWDNGSEGNYWSNYNGINQQPDDNAVLGDLYAIPVAGSVAYPAYVALTGDTRAKVNQKINEAITANVRQKINELIAILSS
jgi:parallel beta-helix repeat protein